MTAATSRDRLTGTVRRIRFVDGEPALPNTVGPGTAFPDGVGEEPA